MGVAGAEQENVMRDVVEVILAKVTGKFLDKLPEEERLHLRSLDPSHYQDYVNERAETLPRVTQEEFDIIHDETWEDYFTSAGI